MTPNGPGTVQSRRMAAPTFTEVAAYSVRLDSRTGDQTYTGTSYAAAAVGEPLSAAGAADPAKGAAAAKDAAGGNVEAARRPKAPGQTRSIRLECPGGGTTTTVSPQDRLRGETVCSTCGRTLKLRKGGGGLAVDRPEHYLPRHSRSANRGGDL